MNELGVLGKVLVLVGVAFVTLGALFWGASRLGFGSLPGDLKLNGAGWSCYIPIVTSIALSLLLTLLLNVYLRMFK